MHHVAYFLDRLHLPRTGRQTRAPTAAATSPASPALSVLPGPARQADHLPASALDAVLDPHQEVIDRIKICYGMGSAAFERDLLCVIRRYAALVHLLPATPDNYFAAPGGLLRMGLEVGFFSLQGTDAHIFCGRATISTRRHLEPRWRLATFIAGLCSELAHALTRVKVSSMAGTSWLPDRLPLAQWLAQHAAPGYRVTWTSPALFPASAERFALMHVIPAALLLDLAAGNSLIVPQLLACLGGQIAAGAPNVIADLVHRSAALVIERALHADPEQPPPAGVHWARYLVDVLRHLITSDPAWRPNSERARIWFGSDGAFLVWPGSAADVRRHLEHVQWHGIPKDPNVILQTLLEAGVILPAAGGQPLWQIVPPPTQTRLDAVRIASPGDFFAGLAPMPQALPCAVSSTPAPSAAPASSAAPANAAASLHPPTVAIDATPVHVEATSDGAAITGRQTPAVPQHPMQPVGTLDAPLRLHPGVRAALADIIAGLAPAVPAKTSTGETAGDVFIPLAAFACRQLEPSIAWRALADARMLVPNAHLSTPLVSREIDGESVAGVLLQAGFIHWRDAGTPATMSGEGKSDAAAPL